MSELPQAAATHADGDAIVRPLAREAEQRGLGYLGYLQALLEGELAHRQEQQLRQRLKAAAFPYQKRLEDFDFSLIPCSPKCGS